MLTYMTAGESHGKGIAALVCGLPYGLAIDGGFINHELARRQGGYGRGDRQNIETDKAEIQTGILHGRSMGSPVLLWIRNRDYKIETMPEIERPRPGHGDLSGSIKYRCGIRPILERASARETAGRVAAGALAHLLLRAFDITVVGYVLSIGEFSPKRLSEGPDSGNDAEQTGIPEPLRMAERLRKLRDRSQFYTLSPEQDDEGKRYVERIREEGDSLGGVIEVQAFNVPFGLGTHAVWNEKLDGRLAKAAMAVQAIKGVEIGDGFLAARTPGSAVHDGICWQSARRQERSFGFVRPTNHAGGLEAGITNSQPIVVRAAMKPIPTLRKALPSVDLKTAQAVEASYERSDVCAVSAASVVLENVIAFEIAAALVEKLGGDSLAEMTERLRLLQSEFPFEFGR